MDQLLQHLLNGLLLGSTYSLLGIGLTLVFGLMNVVNFAHGEFYTLGAYAVFGALGPGLRQLVPGDPVAILAGVALAPCASACSSARCGARRSTPPCSS